VIPIEQKPEPDFFDKKVRIPGNAFLQKLAVSQNTSMPKLTSDQWKRHDEWKHIRAYMHNVYQGVCVYCAHWIPRSANPNIDHFIPKSDNPWLAYEWNNYRLASPLANTHKKDYQDVLDPFKIEKNWFFLDFPSLMLKSNPELPIQVQEQIEATIKRLKLNEDEAFIDDRDAWLKRYCLERIKFHELKRVAPFTAYELERQNLVEDIKTIMRYIPDDDDE
jgi:hypothetical protein